MNQLVSFASIVAFISLIGVRGQCSNTDQNGIDQIKTFSQIHIQDNEEVKQQFSPKKVFDFEKSMTEEEKFILSVRNIVNEVQTFLREEGKKLKDFKDIEAYYEIATTSELTLMEDLREDPKNFKKRIRNALTNVQGNKENVLKITKQALYNQTVFGLKVIDKVCDVYMANQE